MENIEESVEKATNTSTIWIQSIPNQGHFPSKVACLSHVSVIAKIKEHFNENQLEMFKTSCFGHFLSMGELKFSAQILHYMQKEDERWILTNSKGLRFGGLEFALITWLRFDQMSKFYITSLRIRDKYLIGENKIHNDQLEEIFLLLCNK